MGGGKILQLRKRGKELPFFPATSWSRRSPHLCVWCHHREAKIHKPTSLRTRPVSSFTAEISFARPASYLILPGLAAHSVRLDSSLYRTLSSRANPLPFGHLLPPATDSTPDKLELQRRVLKSPRNCPSTIPSSIFSIEHHLTVFPPVHQATAFSSLL